MIFALEQTDPKTAKRRCQISFLRALVSCEKQPCIALEEVQCVCGDGHHILMGQLGSHTISSLDFGGFLCATAGLSSMGSSICTCPPWTEKKWRHQIKFGANRRTTPIWKGWRATTLPTSKPTKGKMEQSRLRGRASSSTRKKPTLPTMVIINSIMQVGNSRMARKLLRLRRMGIQ